MDKEITPEEFNLKSIDWIYYELNFQFINRTVGLIDTNQLLENQDKARDKARIMYENEIIEAYKNGQESVSDFNYLEDKYGHIQRAKKV